MERIIYEYSILRFVPDIERGEFVNVGLMMMCKRHRWLKVQSYINEPRIHSLFPSADIARLDIQLSAFLRNDVPAPHLPVEERYRWMAAVKSAIIQTSPSHPGIILAEESINASALLDSTFSRLFERLIL